ncbi:DNA methyltransferase [Deltaproteobacteria bacterium Smac51]|nr:DNA methyltransferase [Deltaproteobacteria bacterium Smac51]
MISQIEYWPVERLVPYINNPRKNDHAVERMAAVIREFGFRMPVMARSDGELVDGHLRLKAAIAMRRTEVPVLLADDLTPEQVRAFRLVANRSATWADWDEDLLAKEIAALMLSGYDITFTGFDQSELDRLIKDAAASESDPDAVPDVPENPIVSQGELWLLGRHRVLCGDALNSVHMGHLLNGKSAAMVWTDPPYNVAYEGKAGTIMNDKMFESSFEDFLLTAFIRMREALRTGGAIYVAHSEAGNGLAFRQAFSRAGLRFASCLIWKKNQSVMGRGDYHWQHEPILYGWKPGSAHKWYGNRKRKTIQEYSLPGLVQGDDGSWQVLVDGKLYHLTGQDLHLEEMATTVIEAPKPQRSDKHPTTKPVALIESMVSNSSPSGGLVLDPFGGSGSTLIACEQLGRNCYTMDYDPKYVQVIIERWQEFTGQQALRESDGRLFDELI